MPTMEQKPTSKLPSWKTSNSILQRVAHLRSRHRPGQPVSPVPPGGRTFLCLPQAVRFKVYRHLLVSVEPIIRPWPKKKFTVQLLRVSKDIFAEAAYCFYGKAHEQDELDADLDTIMSQDDEADTPIPSEFPDNIFQPMIRADGNLGILPAPYASLIRAIHLSYSVPWERIALPPFRQYSNLRLLTIGVATYIEDLPFFATRGSHEEAIYHQEKHQGRFIEKCVRAFLVDGFESVEVVVKQTLLEKAAGWDGGGLDECWARPDKFQECINWYATVDRYGHLQLLEHE